MNEDAEKDLRLTEFDYMIADPHLQMIKAAIPYMPVSQQRTLSLMVKIQELNRTRMMFSGEEISAMGLSPAPSRPRSPIEMLQAIKPYAGREERDMIETLENLQIMLQAMQTA
ncbi:MAG: hypothetical protein Q4C73_03710 [Eubacteriales bacterium]|nr:hypothetical protein [Eubacteriales bacterium]